jgi:hypothetical protein
MANKNKNNDPLLEKVKKGLKYVESSGGIQMMNPHSSATGFYGQLYNAEELENIPYLQGVDRQSFASDTTLQNRLFEDRYYDRIPGVPGLGKNADDLRVEYKKVLEDKGIPFNYTDDEISALSNLLGRQGAREYFGYVLRDGRSLENVFPKIYGPDAEAPNKTPEKYLKTYREGRDLKYGGQVSKFESGGETGPRKVPYSTPAERTKDKLMQYNPDGNLYHTIHPSGTGPTFQSMYPELAEQFGIQGGGQYLQIPYSNKSPLETKRISSIPNPQDMALRGGRIQPPEPTKPEMAYTKSSKPLTPTSSNPYIIAEPNANNTRFSATPGGNDYTSVSFYSYDPNTDTRTKIYNWEDDLKTAYGQPNVNFTDPNTGRQITGGIDSLMNEYYAGHVSPASRYQQASPNAGQTPIRYNNNKSPHTGGAPIQKYGGQMKKYNNYNQGGEPPKKHKDYLQYIQDYPFTGWADSPHDLGALQNAITRDSTLLQGSWFPDNDLMRNLQINREYRDKVKPYTEDELHDLRYEGNQNLAYGGRAIPQAGWGDLWKKFGKNIGTGLAGVADSLTMGILPMEKIVGKNAMEEYGDSFKMGKRFGTAVGILGGAGAFSAAGAAGAAGGAGAGATGATGAAGTASSAGGSGFLGNMGNILGGGSGGGSTLQNVGGDLFNMFQQESSGMMSDNPTSNPYSYLNYGQGNYAQGGKATSMKQDIGQDANVESGEIMFSAKGGQFQSLNPNAPINEIVPGVSEVSGNVKDDGVPVNLPGDDTTFILSKRLGYADKAKKLIQQYKDLFNQKDTGDVIADEGKKMTLSQIKRKIVGYYREQEKEKQEKGLANKPLQAGLGEWFQKGKDWLGTESGQNATNFLGQNIGTLTNLGRAAFSKDAVPYNAGDYTTQYIPQEFNVDTAAIMNPINQSEAATRYAINRGGGSAADIIQGNLATTAKIAPMKANTLGKLGLMENQFMADQYLKGYEADVANKELELQMRGFNEKRGLARQGHLNEGLTGLQEYFTGRRKEKFMESQAPFGNYGSSGNYIGGNSGGYTPWQAGSNQAPTLNFGSTEEWFQNNPLGTFNP